MTERSPLDLIRAKIVERRAAVYKDIRVDGLSDFLGSDVFVRYDAKVTSAEFARRTSKIKPDAPAQALHLSVLADLCHGVFLERDGKQVGFTAEEPTDPDDWPLFDENLRAFLEPGFPQGIENRATSIARALFEAGHSPENVLQAHVEVGKHFRDLSAWISGEDPVGGDDGLGG